MQPTLHLPDYLSHAFVNYRPSSLCIHDLPIINPVESLKVRTISSTIICVPSPHSLKMPAVSHIHSFNPPSKKFQLTISQPHNLTASQSHSFLSPFFSTLPSSSSSHHSLSPPFSPLSLSISSTITSPPSSHHHLNIHLISFPNHLNPPKIKLSSQTPLKPAQHPKDTRPSLQQQGRKRPPLPRSIVPQNESLIFRMQSQRHIRNPKDPEYPRPALRLVTCTHH